MTTMTFTPASFGDPDRSSFTQGHLDGELHALTGLSRDRATAIAGMAADHDHMYATGYFEGFMSRHAATAVTEQLQTRAEILTWLITRDETTEATK